MAASVTIRLASPSDSTGIAAIYAHHVLHGVATFETCPPDAQAMAARISRVIAAGDPWLIAVGPDDELAGYAYAGPYHARDAYRFTCEDTIYLDPRRERQGLGTLLLERLIDAAQACGYRQMVALITAAVGGSVPLHTRLGFTEVGRTRAVGRKHGRWLDVITMQRSLGEGADTPPPVEP